MERFIRMADLCYSDPLSSIAWNVECGGRMNVGRKCNDNRRHERWWRAQWTGMKSKRGTQGNDERKYLLIPIKYNQFNDGYIKPQVQTCLLWIRNTLINSIMKWIQCFLHVNDESTLRCQHDRKVRETRAFKSIIWHIFEAASEFLRITSHLIH